MVKQFGCWNAFEQVSLIFFKKNDSIDAPFMIAETSTKAFL